jgi:hypothetical protein
VRASCSPVTREQDARTTYGQLTGFDITNYLSTLVDLFQHHSYIEMSRNAIIVHQ